MSDPSLHQREQLVSGAPVDDSQRVRPVQPMPLHLETRRRFNEFRYGGYQWRETGRLRFEIRSRTNPQEWHTLDGEEGTCDCWGFKRHGYCSHFTALSAYLKQLRRNATTTPDGPVE